jgi:pimeloyl-ACP methyl ester carboxylesterase
MHDLETGFAVISGAKLYYEAAGEGHPLLLLHAGVADGRMWDDPFARFAGQYRVVRYDMRGFGRSPMPAAEFSGHGDVAGLLDALAIDRAHLVGLSFGGSVAIDFALAYPQRVSALVLCAPDVGGLEAAGEDVYAPSDALKRYWAEESEALQRDDLRAATEANVRMWVDGPDRTPEQVDPVVRQRVYKMQHHAFTIPTPEGARRCPLAPPAFARLGEIRAPTLVLVGDQDVPDFQKRSELVAARIPNARRVVMPGVAHMINMERPDEFNRLVLEFLGQVAG